LKKEKHCPQQAVAASRYRLRGQMTLMELNFRLGCGFRQRPAASLER